MLSHGVFGDDPGVPMPDVGSAPASFSAIFGIMIALVVIGIGFSVVIAIRKYLILKDAGTDPFTVDAAVAAKVLKSDMLRSERPQTDPQRTVEQRLAELDDLHARGVISAEERQTARAEILRG